MQLCWQWEETVTFAQIRRSLKVRHCPAEGMSWPEISMKQGQRVYPAAPQLSWTVATATQMTSISVHLYSKSPRVSSDFRQIMNNTKINQIRSWRRIDTKLSILPTNSFSVFMVFTQALRLGGQSHFSLNYCAPYSLCAAPLHQCDVFQFSLPGATSEALHSLTIS